MSILLYFSAFRLKYRQVLVPSCLFNHCILFAFTQNIVPSVIRMHTCIKINKKFATMSIFNKKVIILWSFCAFGSTDTVLIRFKFGALAQLARVLDWQSRGHRFDSGMLHKKQSECAERERCTRVLLFSSLSHCSSLFLKISSIYYIYRATDAEICDPLFFASFLPARLAGIYTFFQVQIFHRPHYQSVIVDIYKL
jgi:hypothetical protein